VFEGRWSVNQRSAPDTVGGRLARLLHNAPSGTFAELEAALLLPNGISLGDVLEDRYHAPLGDLVAAAEILDVPLSVLTGQTPVQNDLLVSTRLGYALEHKIPTTVIEYVGKLSRQAELLDSWLGDMPNNLKGLPLSRDPHFLSAGKISAQRVRDALGLGNDPIGDLVNLVENSGLPVCFRHLPSGVRGLNVLQQSSGGPPRRIVVITADEPWTAQRFTLAHELCHGLYNDQGQVIVDDVDTPDTKPELRAEAFARHLLLPTESIRLELLKSHWRADQPQFVLYLMVSYGISRDATVRALQSDGLIDAEDADHLRQCSVTQLIAESPYEVEWARLSADDGVESGSPLLVQRALKAYEQGFINAQIVADLLDQGLEETKLELARQGWTTDN
jgi:Zn-dependent peptidase ImmA (M78 family)